MAKQILLKLKKNQERALRIIYKDFDSTYETLLAQSNLTSLFISRIRTMLLEVYKCVRSFNPEYLNKIFKIKKTGYFLRNEVILHLPVPKTTNFCLRSFSYAGAKLWNDQKFSVDVDEECADISRDITLFKTFIKTQEVNLDVNFNFM